MHSCDKECKYRLYISVIYNPLSTPIWDSIHAKKIKVNDRNCCKQDNVFSSAAEGTSGAFQMPIRLSSVVVRQHFHLNLQFLKNCSATFLLITHTASISCRLSPMLIWTPLKNSKGPLKGPTRRPKMHIFTHFAYFLKNCSATFSLLVHIASI